MNHFKWVNFIIYEIDLKIAVKKKRKKKKVVIHYTYSILNFLESKLSSIRRWTTTLCTTKK